MHSIEIFNLVLELEKSWLYYGAFLFLSIYPMFFGFLWIFTALGYHLSKENRKTPNNIISYTPFVSVVIPVFNEAELIQEALHATLNLDYPLYEVVIVNDGSTDNTLESIKAFQDHPKLRIINKLKNEGKAAALNNATPYLNGEVILYLDADALPQLDILKKIIPHFANKKVAGVTGNPRVRNIASFIGCLQLLEYTSIVSLLRRSQHLWGVLMTMAGVVLAVRKNALEAVGGFRENMKTEDICLTWDLQRAGYKLAYESYAVVWMTVPSRIKYFIKQRMRWARGQYEVLHLHAGVMLKKQHCIMWLIYTEAILSILWSALFVAFSFFFILTLYFFQYPLGLSLIPLFWGVLIAFTSLLMQLVGIYIESKHDKTVKFFYPYAIFYPLVYWLLLSIISTINLPFLFRKLSKQKVKWSQEQREVYGENK